MGAATTSRARSRPPGRAKPSPGTCLGTLARLGRSRLAEASGACSRKASASRRRAVTVTFLSSSSGDVPPARPTRPARAPSGVISWHHPSDLPTVLRRWSNSGSVRIAVVGAGISGLGAAYLLSRAHDVELFEREERAGGHVNTIEHRGLGLDAGFIVHNEPNYPYLNRLFRELGVHTQDSEMSFSVSCGDCGLEWSGRRPFAQKRNLVSRQHLGLLAEVARWLRTAVSTLDASEGLSLGQYSERHGYSRRFRSHFLVPLTSALWSTAPERALDFPASYAIRFFEHHGMLGFGRFRWRTVTGGSRGYVRALLERLPGRVHLGRGVRAIQRQGAGVDGRTEDGATARFD